MNKNKSPKNRKNIAKSLIAALLILLSLPLIGNTSIAENKTIKVGFIDGYAMKQDGELYTGYAFEYLSELSKYTGLIYEFVPGTWQSNMEKLENGEIDIISPIHKITPTPENLIYSKEEIGFEYLGLYTSANNTELLFDDFTNFDGMTVGSFSQNPIFEEYKTKHNFKTNYKFFDNVDEMVLAARNGKIDAYILESSAQYSSVKMIAKLDVVPTYIVAKKDNNALMNNINQGIAEIRRNDIYYTANLYEKYYGKDMVGAPAYTPEEQNFIDSNIELKIAFDPNIFAIEEYDIASKTYTGIFPDIVKLLAEKSNLNLSYQPVSNYKEAQKLFENGELDIITGYIYDVNDFSTSYTDPIFNLSSAFATKKNANLTIGSSVGYLEKYNSYLPLFQNRFPSFEFISYPNNNELLKAISKGKITAGLINSFTLNVIIARGEYPDIKLFGSANLNFPIRLLIADKDPLLSSIINKTLKRIGTEEINDIVMKNTVTSDMQVSLAQVLKQYMYPIIATIFSILTLILSYILYTTRKNRKKLYNLAFIDPLTKLGNYNKFKLDAQKILEHAHDEKYQISKFDIDKFKVYNELFGRESGDTLLITISECLTHFCEANTETFARVSADEFIILKKYISIETVQKQRIEFEKQLRQMLPVPYDIRLNYGRYKVNHGETSINMLYEKVNFAHRAAKEKTGGNIRDCDYDNDLMNTLIQQKELENNMDEAIKNNDFLVYIQPKYQLSNETIGGGEALVRWQSPGKEMVYPATFIPLFEQNGFITKLDMYMFENVCKLMSKWAEEGRKPITISVNFSRLNLNNEDFVKNLSQIADKYAVPRHLLEIELTESIIFDSEGILINVLEKLHGAGFLISMDDFGSGYSSLGLLKNMPVDIIKLDRSFFLSAQNSKKAFAILAHMIEMAKDMEINTVAEGVELKEQVGLLKSLGCTMVQGYYYSKPLPVSDFEKLI